MTEIDLAISGSGTRFGAFVGSLKALEEHGLKPKRIAATSGGAIIGSLYALGYDVMELQAIFMKMDISCMKSFRPWRWFSHGGYYSNDKFLKQMKKLTKGAKVKDTDIEVHLCALDVQNNDGVIINKDTFPDLDLAEAVLISSSIPFYFGYRELFNPRIGATMRMIDGAYYKNYPIDVFKDRPRPLFGFWMRGLPLGGRNPYWNKKIYINNVLRAFADSLTKEHVEDAYWAVTIPVVVNAISSLDFDINDYTKRLLIEQGYESVNQYLKGRL